MFQENDLVKLKPEHHNIIDEEITHMSGLKNYRIINSNYAQGIEMVQIDLGCGEKIWLNSGYVELVSRKISPTIQKKKPTVFKKGDNVQLKQEHRNSSDESITKLTRDGKHNIAEVYHADGITMIEIALGRDKTVLLNSGYVEKVPL